MARTRGSSNAFHMDDGELLDKEGKPIPTVPVRGVIHMDDGELVPVVTKEAPEPIAAVLTRVAFLCDRTTWHKSMEAFDAMLLMDMYMGGLTVTLTSDEAMKLHPNARQHFRRVVLPVEE